MLQLPELKASTGVVKSYDHVLFLLKLVHVFATTHRPKICYQVIFAATDEPFCYNRFDFLLLPVFVDFCYIHLLFFLSFLLQPYFDFAGTEDIFCYIHPRRCCSTAAMAFFCYNRLGYLLLPEMPFCYHRSFCYYQSLPRSIRSFCYHPCFCFVFARTILNFCYRRLLILLEPAFFASVSAVKAGGVLVRRRR